MNMEGYYALRAQRQALAAPVVEGEVLALPVPAESE